MFESTKTLIEYLVAGNPLTPAKLLGTLARSPEPCVRARVAENQSASVSTLVQLLADADR